MNNSGSSVLPTFDFSTLGNLQNRYINVTSLNIISSNGGVSIANEMVPVVHLFNANTIPGSTLTDNTPFNPSYTAVIKKEFCQ